MSSRIQCMTSVVWHHATNPHLKHDSTVPQMNIAIPSQHKIVDFHATIPQGNATALHCNVIDYLEIYVRFRVSHLLLIRTLGTVLLNGCNSVTNSNSDSLFNASICGQRPLQMYTENTWTKSEVIECQRNYVMFTVSHLLLIRNLGPVLLNGCNTVKIQTQTLYCVNLDQRPMQAQIHYTGTQTIKLTTYSTNGSTAFKMKAVLILVEWFETPVLIK